MSTLHAGSARTHSVGLATRIIVTLVVLASCGRRAQTRRVNWRPDIERESRS